MRTPARVVVCVLALAGCGRGFEPEPEPEPCLSAQVLDADICQVLDSGLVLHREGEQLWASRLHDDGSLEPILELGDSVACHAVAAHDPVTAKLWWIEDNVLARLDMASNTIDWQRELVFDERMLIGLNDLLVHEGAVYVGGPSAVDLESFEFLSVLARIDDEGQVVWSHVGYPGFGFSPESDGSPMSGVDQLMGTSTGISFIGALYGIDSQALTLATVDADTGELLWSSVLDRDNYDGINAVASDGELLYVLAGATEPSVATTTTAITPLGEPQWQTSEYVWGLDFSAWSFGHAAVGGSSFTATAHPGDAPVARVVRWSAGDFECELDLPEATAVGISGFTAWPVGDQFVLRGRGSLDEVETELFILLTPGA